MDLLFHWQTGKIELLSDSQTLNANDVMWHKLNVRLDPAFTTQSLFVTFSNEEAGDYTHDILLGGDGAAGTLDFPEEVIRVPGDWTFQLFVREYSTVNSSLYKQKASDKVAFYIKNGLQTDGEGNPVTNASLASLYATSVENVKKMQEIADETKEYVAENFVSLKGEQEVAGKKIFKSEITTEDHPEASQAKASVSYAGLSVEEATQKTTYGNGNILYEKDSVVVRLALPKTGGTLARTEDIDVLEAKVETSQGEQEKKIDMLIAAGEQSGEYYKATLEEAFETRQTARGLSVIDPSIAIVQKIKGSTVKSENLIPYPYCDTTKTLNGITFTDNGDGSITVNGTATANATFDLTANSSAFPSFMHLEFGTYILSSINISSNIELRGTISYSDGTTFYLAADIPFTIEKEYNYVRPYLVILSGQTVSNVTFYPMLNKGTTALPYRPYFTGLKHANFEKIVSTGNLLPYPYLSTGVAQYFEDMGDGSIRLPQAYTSTLYCTLYNNDFANALILPAGTYTVSCGGLVAGVRFVYRIFDADGTQTAQVTMTNTSPNATFTIVDGQRFTIYIALDSSFTEVGTILKPMLNYGSSAKSFISPTIAEEYSDGKTYSLPEYDYILPQTGEIVRGSGKRVYTANEVNSAIAKYTNVWYFSVNKPIDSFFFGRYTNNYIADKFEIRDANNGWDDANMIGCSNGGAASTTIWIGFPPDTTIEEAKTKIAGFEIAYKLATPTTETVNLPNGYIAYSGGSETVEQGEEDNSKYGAVLTVENQYFVSGGEEDETT